MSVVYQILSYVERLVDRYQEWSVGAVSDPRFLEPGNSAVMTWHHWNTGSEDVACETRRCLIARGMKHDGSTDGGKHIYIFREDVAHARGQAARTSIPA